MKNNLWENFANTDAEYYILTENPYPSNSKEGKEFFFTSGEEQTNKLLADIREKLDFSGTVCEIGCGVGRLLIPHARLFKNSVGVDISKTMLDKLMKNANEMNIGNITAYLSSEPWHTNQFAYVYSFIVFQHISDFEIIEDYIMKVGNSLQENGIAKLHFDTRKRSLSYRIRNAIPDFLLPKPQKKGIRRIRRSPEKLKAVFTKANLKLVNETGQDSAHHIFILKK